MLITELKHPLSNVVRELNEGNYDEAIELLVSPEIRINRVVNFIVYGMKTINDEELMIIELIIKILQDIYNNSELISPVSDELYDMLYDIYLSNGNKDIIGAPVKLTSNNKISNHTYPDLRGTLDKIHFITNDEKKPDEKRKSLEDWIKRIENKLDEKINPIVYLFPKWDGISCVQECDENGIVKKALKRGDTIRNEAEELTELFKGIDFSCEKNIDSGDIMVNEPYGVKCEVIMSHGNFEKLIKKYKNFKSPRSAVSSIINSDILDKKYLPYLTVIPLQIQFSNNSEIFIAPSSLNVFPYRKCRLKDFETIKSHIEELRNEVNDKMGIDIDGIVVSIIDSDLKIKLGRIDNINKYQVAYKFPPESARTVINDVFMSVGVFSSITPVAQIKPVKLKGNTISNISLGSIDRFESLNLSPGDEVIIKYDVIPYLEIDSTCKKSGNEPFKTPTHCPVCGNVLVLDPVLRCVNLECDSRIIGKILNYVNKMDIANISVSRIRNLYNAGILTSIVDLYKLDNHKKEIINMEGFGKKSYQRLIDDINSRKDVYDYELIGSIGIPDVGRKIFKKILDVYEINKLFKICENNNISELTKISGIKELTAKKIIRGININRNLLEQLIKILNVKRDTRTYTIKVAFTKVRDPEFAKYLDSQNVLVLDSYTKDVDILIVPSLSTHSSKVDKAIKQNKQIISLEDAYKLFNYNI